MSDINEKKDSKSLIETQQELSQNVRLWYSVRFFFDKSDTLSTKIYKICMRIIITLVMIAFSPILFVVLIVALVGAG